MRLQRRQLTWLLIAALVGGCAQPQTTDIGQAIQQRYEAELATLPIHKQKHFALRMYRITGSEEYLGPIIADLMVTANSLGRDIENLDDRAYRQARTEAIVVDYPDHSEKYRKRKALLGRSGEIAFAKSLLYRVNKVREYGLMGSPFFRDVDKAIPYFEQVDFESFLLDPAVIRIYAAQMANNVYYLHDLGVSDLRQDYLAAFRRTFPETEDAKLTNAEFRSKVYGMSHLVLAASGYYQHRIERADFDWIYSYFERHIERIMRRTKPDIYTEVALCFLLAGELDHPVVAQVKRALVARYDPRKRIIPSTVWGTDLEKGEHRNVLAIMLFRWPKRLHPGPELMQFERYREVIAAD